MKNEYHPHKDNQKDDIFLIFLLSMIVLLFIFDKTPAKAIETYETEQQARVIRLQIGE